VLYVPEEYPAHEKVGLPTIEPEGESRIEQIRRRAPGESPTVKSLRRHFEKSAAD